MRKVISLEGRPFTVYHLGDSDPYFGAITDDYGQDLRRFCQENLTPDSVVFDIGANIGLTTFVLSQYADKVFAFEPNPTVFPLLKQNMEANKLGNVSVHQMAVGATSGVTHFAGTSAFGYMAKDASLPAVQVETVDRLVVDLGVDRLDLLKIDVEGFEPDVLAGARQTIKRLSPTIYMEFNAWCMLHNARVNPCDFADTIMQEYGEVRIMRADGASEPAPNATNLVYENFFKYGSVNDLVLRHPRF